MGNDYKRWFRHVQSMTNLHCYTGVVFFWIKTIGLYIATAVFALFISLAGSLCLVRVLNGPSRPDEDSPALGILLILLFVSLSSLFVPTFLGLTAELVQGKVLARPFSWVRGLRRILLALPAGIGPAYTLWVLMLREDARPTRWLANLVLLLAVSAVFSFLSLRIKRRLAQPPHLAGRS